MRRNPRPIPLNTFAIKAWVELFLESLEEHVLSLENSPLFRVPVIHAEQVSDKLEKQGVEIEDIIYDNEPYFFPAPLTLQNSYRVDGSKIEMKGGRYVFEKPSKKKQDWIIIKGGWQYLPVEDDEDPEYTEKFNLHPLKITLNSKFSPHDWKTILSDSDLYEELQGEVYNLMLHEFTHARDMIPKEFITFEQHGRGKYLNDANEVRARMREMVNTMEIKLLHGKQWEYYRKRMISEPFFNLVEEWFPDWDGTSERNRYKAASVAYQWLQENGFDLPRRRF